MHLSTPRREPALHVSVRNGISSDVERMLERGVSVNARNIHGESALVIAVKERNKHVARMLLHHGADPWLPLKRCGKTALHLAAKCSDADMLNILLNEELSSGRNVCSMIKNFCRPARKNAYYNINTPEKFGGNTVLHYAVLRRDPAMVVTLLKHVGVGINIKNNIGMTPLHLAAVKGLTKIVKLLLNEGAWNSSDCYVRAEVKPYIADVAATDNYGRTPLHLTTVGSVAEYLLKKGAPIDHQDSEYCTPLHLALQQQCLHNHVFEVLLFAGANLDLLDITGQRSWTLIDNCFQENNSRVTYVLLKFQVANVKRGITDRFDFSKMIRPDRFLKEFNDELEKARNTLVGGVSFYTILTNSRLKCVSNDAIVNAIHADNLISEFPHYYRLMRMSIGEAEKFKHLVDELSEEFSIVLSSVLSLNIPADVGRLIIIDLSDQDMKHLKNALL